MSNTDIEMLRCVEHILASHGYEASIDLHSRRGKERTMGGKAFVTKRDCYRLGVYGKHQILRLALSLRNLHPFKKVRRKMMLTVIANDVKGEEINRICRRLEFSKNSGN